MARPTPRPPPVTTIDLSIAQLCSDSLPSVGGPPRAPPPAYVYLMALTTEQLTLLDETLEVRIETHSDDGPLKTTIWVVVADGEVYVRSLNGEKGLWYQRTISNPFVAIHVNSERLEFRAVHVKDPDLIATVSEALRAKYPPGGSLDRMTREEVLDTTFHLEPES